MTDRSRNNTASVRWATVLAACFWLASAAGLSNAAAPPADPGAARLRVLTLDARAANHPHRNVSLELTMLHDYARANSLALEWIEIYRPQDLYDMLVRGEGDLVVGALPPELVRSSAITSTEAIATERYQLVGRTGTAARNPLQLNGLHIAAHLSSPLWPYLQQLRRVLPRMRLDALPNHLDREEVLRLVADGVYDATVVPTASGDDALTDHPRLKALFDLTDVQPVSWYVRGDNARLRDSLNGFIERFHTAYFEPVTAPRDFRAIQARGVLRVITRLDSQNYYLADGKPAGHELELIAAFAEAHRLRLEVLVGSNEAQILEWLKIGAADIITTRVDGNEVRSDPAFRMSRRYHYTAYAIVSGLGKPVPTPAALQNRVVAAYEDSAELRALKTMQRDLPSLKVISVDPGVSRKLLLDRVARGAVDATVLDGDTVAEIAGRRSDLLVGASIPHAYQYRWTLRGSDDQLLSAVNSFLRASYANGLNATLANRYLDKYEKADFAIAGLQGISPFDALVRTYSDRYGFDWRLITALMYQESQFNPRAVSRAGATGLMQMLPSTARSLGFGNLREPETSIHAGVKYLYKLRNEFAADVPVSERTWFALAAYNTGRDRVERARQLAAKLNLDPNKWFGNVEDAMLRMARRSNGRSSGQAIIYVQAIQSLYGVYRYLQVSALPAGKRGEPPA